MHATDARTHVRADTRRQAGRYAGMQAGWQAGRQAGRPAVIQANRQAGGGRAQERAGRWAVRHTHTQQAAMHVDGGLSIHLKIVDNTRIYSPVASWRMFEGTFQKSATLCLFETRVLGKCDIFTP